MKKKKLNLLLPISKCCLKKFYDLDIISKYGSISTISILTLYQGYNVLVSTSVITLLSLIITLFFLIIVLVKLNLLEFKIFKEKINIILKFMIFILILNFLAYLNSDVEIHSYIFAPISFLGAYFIFLLLLK